MCTFDRKLVPKGWQWVCLKSSGQVPHDSQECSCFLSPNGKTFRSLELALQYHRELEKAKLEKENRRLMKGSFGLENTVTKVNNSSMLGCNYCEQKFFAPTMVKKHEREVHRMYGSSRMINCEHCSESFQAMPLLQKHVREFHTKQQCKFCGKQFESIYRLDTHVFNHHRKASVPPQPLNLQQREPPKNSFQYNPREIENRMAEIVSRNPNAPREVKQFLDSNQSSRASAGISFSGPSLKNPKSNLNSVRLERNNPYKSEAESRMSSLKDVTFSRKQKHQPLGPQIMEQYLASSNSQANLNQQNSFPFWGNLKAESSQNLSSEEMVSRLKKEYQMLNPPSNPMNSNPLPNPPSQLPQMFKQSLPPQPAPRRPAPISGEEMLKALNSKSEISNARRRGNVSLPIMRREVSRTGLRKVSKKVGYKLKPLRKQAYKPGVAGKNQISVSLACKYLGLKDYPVPINENNRKFFEIQSNFEDYYLPLVASVNKGANALSIQTLVRAKWFEVLKAKPGESRSIYFNKPRRNKVKVNAIVS